MAQLTKKRKNGNGNGSSFPSSRNSVFPSRLFRPGLMDFDDDFWDFGSFGNQVPAANIAETDKEFTLDLSAPGLAKEDFKIDVDNGILTVSSEIEEESKSEEKNYTRREFSYSSFSRSFTLPENVKENDINARYDNGVLHVTIPKKEVSVSKLKKQIQVA